MLNRLERVGEMLRAALNALAVVAPEWLRQVAEPQWFERYGSRVKNYDLPKTETARKALTQRTGADGQRLLQAIDAATEQPWPQIVNVEMTPATTPDDHMAAVVHQSLKGRNLLPREHLKEGVTSVVSYSTKGIRPTAPRFGNGADYKMAVSHFEFHFVSQVALLQERFGYADTTGITDANDVGFHSKS